MNSKVEVKVLNVSKSEIPKLLAESAKIHQIRSANMKLFADFIQPNPDYVDNYQRYYNCILYMKKDINIIKESITFQGVELNATAASEKKTEALNISSSILITKILEVEPNIMMPRYVIGIANYRGHCFFVPVFVSLFNFKPFVEALLKGHEIASDFIKKTGIPKPESKKSREDEYLELPFLWTRIIKRFYQQYKKVSHDGKVVLRHLPKNIHLAYPKLYSSNLNYVYSSGYKPDLNIDRALMKVVLELKSFHSTSYSKPGGHCTYLYHTILKKLNQEYIDVLIPSPFQDICFVGISFEYTCLKCGQHCLKQQILEPTLNIPHMHSKFKDLQELVNSPRELLGYQDSSKCKQKRRGNLGDVCESIITNLDNVKITKIPILLAFMVGNFGSREIYNLSIPDELIFGNKRFKKIAYSDLYECWADEHKKLRSTRKIAKEANDKSAGWHVNVNVLTQDGWMEINNDEVFFSKKYYGFSEPGNIVLYCQIEKFFPPKSGSYTDEYGVFHSKVFDIQSDDDEEAEGNALGLDPNLRDYESDEEDENDFDPNLRDYESSEDGNEEKDDDEKESEYSEGREEEKEGDDEEEEEKNEEKEDEDDGFIRDDEEEDFLTF